GDAGLMVLDVEGEHAADRVVLDEVGERRVVGEVVHSDDLDVCVLLDSFAQEIAPDTTEAVDADLKGLGSSLIHRMQRNMDRLRARPRTLGRRRQCPTTVSILSMRGVRLAR